MSSFQAWERAGASSSSIDVPIYATASLPAPTNGLIAKLSDGSKGLVYANGTTWAPVEGLDTYVIEDFGGKADAGITDNLTAWNAIMAVIKINTSGYGVQSGPNGAIIRFGKGVYNFGTTPKLIVPGCIVEGSGGAYPGQRTLLTVPCGQQGFIVGDANQDGGSGAGAYIRNLGLSGNGYLVGGTASNVNVNGWAALTHYNVGDFIQPAYAVNNGSKWGGYLWRCSVAGVSGASEPSWPIANTLSTYTESNPTQADGAGTLVWQAVQAHGLVVHGTAFCENITVSAFAGDGFHIYGDTVNSNADLSMFTNCAASSNFGSGFWTAGNDSAPSTYTQCNAIANFGYGYYDYSLEGNIYIDCHARSNGSQAWQVANTPALNTFVSPTIPNDYLYMVTTAGGATGSTEPSWPTSIGATVTSGAVVLTCERHYSGGPYYMRNSGMLTCYDESGQQPIILATENAWSRGGSHGAGYVADPSAALGRIEDARFSGNNSFAVDGDNGDGHPLRTWIGPRNGLKIGFSVAKLTAGTPVTGTTMDLAYATGNTSNDGWSFEIDGALAATLTDGTESGTIAGQLQVPGLWIGGPQAAAGGSYVNLGSHVTAPTGGQLGDMAIGAQGAGAGIGTWHQIGTNADDGNVARWAIGAEAGAFHPIDVSSTSVGSPYIVTRGDHNAVFHNKGASGKSAVTLRFADEFPYARQKFINDAATGMRIVSQHGSKIIFGSIDGGDGGYLETTQIGATLTVESITGIYFVVASTGTWNANGVVVVQPGIETLLSSVVVDSSIGTKQALYTIPAGHSCIITKVIIRSASGGFTTGNASVGFNAGAADVIANTFFLLPAATGTFRINAPAQAPFSEGMIDGAIGAAAAVFGIKFNSTDTPTATIDAFGYLF